MCWVCQLVKEECERCARDGTCYDHDPNTICRVCGKKSDWAVRYCYDHDPNTICRHCGRKSGWAYQCCYSCRTPAVPFKHLYRKPQLKW